MTTNTLKYDLPAGIVVFLVALPLCLGIALASGAPLFSGIISGIIGGIVVGLASGSHTSVSGPAAGLTAIVAAAILKLPSFETFLLSVFICGALQIVLGFIKAGVIGDYVPNAVIKKGLSEFRGVGRRFTKVGEVNGAAIIDDYAHNPFKIAAAVKAARQAYKGPIVAVVQPHRYTRLRDTFEQFSTCLNDADVAVIAPVYAAGEAPIEGINRDSYAEALRAHGHRNVITIEGEDDLAAAVAPYVKPGAAIVGTGAGSITGWMNNLPKKLEGLL